MLSCYLFHACMWGSNLFFPAETHDWEDSKGNKGAIGQFGHYHLCKPKDFESRIVQLGWAIWKKDAPIQVKERLIRPDGFCISAKAERFHKISQSMAERDGLALKDVLAEFLGDVREVQKQGGRLCCHHLEFDGNIIQREMERCGADTLDFCKMLRQGCCTMSPEIGRWLKECFGEDAGPNTAKNTMKLSVMVKWLLPNCAPLLQKHHTAGADADLHVRLFLEICRLCQQASR